MKGHRRAAVLLFGLTVAFALGPATANAHPLGNATVNHYDGLHLYPDHITDSAVEDIAEIPTLQRKPLIDTNRDGTISAGEATGYAEHQCAALARSVSISVNGRQLPLAVIASAYTQRPGAIQLLIGRLTCELTAKTDLAHPAQLAINDSWDSAGIGWHEITAVGTEITLHRSPFPARSISDQLLHYPNDLLSSPINVRSGTVTTTPGAGASTYAVAQQIPAAGPLLRVLNHIANAFNDLVGRKHVTVGVGLAALLLSMLLGAGHALLPGHGKTIMAAYLVGRRGRLRDVAAVGATVTLTHTAGVLILGALISATTAFAPTEAEQDLAIVSGLMVVMIGLGLLIAAIRQPRTSLSVADVVGSDDVDTRSLVSAHAPAARASHHHDDHQHVHPHDHSHASSGTATLPHQHGFGRAHHHGPDHVPAATPHVPPARNAYSRSGLVGLGMAGGLVPSPSALLVLLATIALGRTVFGVVLVLGYGLGMAATLCAAGVLLVRLRGRLARMSFGRRLARAQRLAAIAPYFTSALVVLVGIWLTLRGVGGTV